MKNLLTILFVAILFAGLLAPAAIPVNQVAAPDKPCLDANYCPCPGFLTVCVYPTQFIKRTL